MKSWVKFACSVATSSEQSCCLMLLTAFAEHNTSLSSSRQHSLIHTSFTHDGNKPTDLQQGQTTSIRSKDSSLSKTRLEQPNASRHDSSLGRINASKHTDQLSEKLGSHLIQERS